MRRAGNRVRVTVQLMNAQDGFQLWSERFDRDLDDIFAIQDEIARGIVEQLQVTLGLKHATVPLVARPTDDLEAYELYLRGREAAHAALAAVAAPRDRVLQAGARPRPERMRARTSGSRRRTSGSASISTIPTIEARAPQAEEAIDAARRS